MGVNEPIEEVNDVSEDDCECGYCFMYDYDEESEDE